MAYGQVEHLGGGNDGAFGSTLGNSVNPNEDNSRAKEAEQKDALVREIEGYLRELAAVSPEAAKKVSMPSSAMNAADLKNLEHDTRRTRDEEVSKENMKNAQHIVGGAMALAGLGALLGTEKDGQEQNSPTKNADTMNAAFPSLLNGTNSAAILAGADGKAQDENKVLSPLEKLAQQDPNFRKLFEDAGHDPRTAAIINSIPDIAKVAGELNKQGVTGAYTVPDGANGIAMSQVPDLKVTEKAQANALA